MEQHKNVSDTIWENIQNVEVSVFGLPGRPVNKFCSRIEIEPSKLYLKLGVQAFLPVLEATFGKQYDVSMGKLYCELSPKDK